jgi:hypothetical protein
MFRMSDAPIVRSQPGRDPDLVTHYAADGSEVGFDIRDRPEKKRSYAPDTLFMSLTNASERLGVSATTLRRAAAKGTLRTKRYGNEWLTTPLWLQEYAKNRRPAGRPRKTA